MRQDRDKEKIL